MTKKKKSGYGNVSPRFQKYFARKQNSSGPHDPKNAKQQAQSEAALKDMHDSLDDLFDSINCYDENELLELQERYTSRWNVYELGETVAVVNQDGKFYGELGRVVTSWGDHRGMSYGIVFNHDENMNIFYFTGKDLERQK